MQASGTVEKVLAPVVGGVFAVAAVGLLWVLGTMFANHHAAHGWVAVSTEVDSAGIRSSRSSGISPARSTVNSRPTASYRYRYNGRDYSGSRVDFSFGSDNFAGARRGRQMEMLRGDAPTVYVNPDNPAESVLDPSLPVEQVNFALIFLFFPCGLGTAMLLGWSAHLASKAGWEGPNRFFPPALGFLHSVPAFYAPLFAPADLGPFGWLLVLVAVAVFSVSSRSAWRRFRDPTVGAPRWSHRLSR